MLAFPDAAPHVPDPALKRPKHDGAARIFCDVCTPDRQLFAGDSRECLRRMFYRAEKLGYIMNVGAELEVDDFPDERTPEPMDKVGDFDPHAVGFRARPAPFHRAHAREDEHPGGVHLP